MQDNIILKKLNAGDLPQYHSLRAECLLHHPQNFGTIYEEELKSPGAGHNDIILKHHKTDFMAGVFDDKQLIGICGFKQETRAKTKHIGRLGQMYVSTPYQGLGLGKRLLHFTIETAFTNPGLEQIILAVAKKNKVAKSLYKKCGFMEYGRLKDYFKSGNKYETQLFLVLTRKKYEEL